MKKFLINVIFGGFILLSSGCSDNKSNNSTNICDLDFVKDELKSSVSNEMLELRNVKCQNNKLIYDFIYTPKYSANLEKLNGKEKEHGQTTAKNMIKSMYCEMPEFEPYRQNGVVLHYEYSTTNIDKFYEVEISNKDCKN